MHSSRKTLHTAKLVLFVPLVVYLLFIIPEKYGYWDQVKGLDLVQQIADRFERSVGPDDAVPVRSGDREFDPTIALIKKYSATKLAYDKTPQVIARGQAHVYDSQPQGKDKPPAQWTSPATPIYVLYYVWPNTKFPGGTVPPDLVSTVGTLGDLHDWVRRSHEDMHFLIVDLLLVGVVPLVVGVYEYIVEKRFEH